MGSLGMLFYVVECFSVNLENLAADAVRSAQLGGINEQIQGDRGFVAVALCKSAHQIDQIGALHAQRAEVGNDLAQLRALILDGLLEAGEAADGLVWRGSAGVLVERCFREWERRAQRCFQARLSPVFGMAYGR